MLTIISSKCIKWIMSKENDPSGPSYYELITGLHGWFEETWTDPHYSLEKNTTSLDKIDGAFLNGKQTIDALIMAMEKGEIAKEKIISQFHDLSLKPVHDQMSGRLFSKELSIRLKNKGKVVGRGEIKFFEKQPIDRYCVETKTSDGLHFDYPEIPRKDKIWFSYLTWNSSISFSQEEEMEGNIFYIMYSFSPKPMETKHNSEVSRLYTLYKGVRVEDLANNQSCSIGLVLNSFGSDLSGFRKIVELPHINQKFIEFQFVKLPLYTDLVRGTPWIAG